MLCRRRVMAFVNEDRVDGSANSVRNARILQNAGRARRRGRASLILANENARGSSAVVSVRVLSHPGGPTKIMEFIRLRENKNRVKSNRLLPVWWCCHVTWRRCEENREPFPHGRLQRRQGRGGFSPPLPPRLSWKCDGSG